MKLSQLLAPLGLSCPEDPEITALTCDSRAVTPGALFVALEGAREDGRRFIRSAVERGAAAVLRGPDAADDPAGAGGLPVPVVAVADPRRALAMVAAELYGHPAEAMTMIAVTGTKGKTTTAHMIRDILTAGGRRVGMIGTLGAFIGRRQIAAPANTTPEPVELHRLLRAMADRGCTHVVMEVSSQAMKLGRVEGIEFAAAVFLNLSPDHIGGGEHADFDEYRACKAALVRQCRLAIGNADDPNWPVMRAQVSAGTPTFTFGFGEKAQVRGASVTPDGGSGPLCTRFTVAGAAAPYIVPLPGAFNAADALAALAVCRALWVDDRAIRAGLAQTSVPGRTQLFPAPTDYPVIIDYAHNGESFRALLSALAGYEHRRLIVVFGAGGDRPKMRRWDMAGAAAEWADFAILTEDNPRSERARDICREIADCIGDAIPYLIIPDRREAIRQALDMALPGVVIALLGKGHEQYIETNGVRRPFSEWAVLEEYFRDKR